MGYYRAGFEVVGVDIKPQPRYPFEFHQADALRFPLHGFDVVHASPPCQAFTVARHRYGRSHPDLLTPTRVRLEASGLPWVIENVPGAPMRADVVLCGSAFGLGVRRHRWFETNSRVCPLVPTCDHSRPTLTITGHGGGAGPTSRWKHWTVAEGRSAMGIDWMTGAELSQAIPPAYTEWIGAQLLAHVGCM